MICGVLTDTVVICHRVGPVSRRLLVGYSVCCVIHGQDAVSCTKKSLCIKTEKMRGETEQERGVRHHCARSWRGWLSLN